VKYHFTRYWLEHTQCYGSTVHNCKNI